MSKEEKTEAHTGSRKRVLVSAGVTAALVLGAIAALVWLAPDRAGPPLADPVVVVKPVAPAPTTQPGVLEDASAADVIAHILAIPIDPVETVDDLNKLMGNVAADGYLIELENQWQELVVNGWSVEGTPKVITAEVTDMSETHATVTACIDSSSVRTLDAEGDAIGAASTTRGRNIFTLDQSNDGVWRITSHSFPNDPAC